MHAPCARMGQRAGSTAPPTAWPAWAGVAKEYPSAFALWAGHEEQYGAEDRQWSLGRLQLLFR